LLKPLDRQTHNDGSLVTAWDGTVIVSHHGVIDRRLLAFNPDGTLRWERSIAALTAQAPELVAVGRRVYAVTTEGDVWWIDPQTGDTQRVLHGHRLDSLPGQIHILVTNLSTLIIDYRGGRLIALDPRRAVTSIEQDDVPQRDAPGRITP
jgi:outer membrane protein assembly factor BamB